MCLHLRKHPRFICVAPGSKTVSSESQQLVQHSLWELC